MFKKFFSLVGGDPNKRTINKYSEIVNAINALEDEFNQLSDIELIEKTDQYKHRLATGESLEDLLVEAFAAVREASKRTIGLRHYDVQLIGGICLHQGNIAEMRTGEGKTLVATLPIYLNALTQKGVHLITVNDYLARRDARWMAPIYSALGLSIGVLQIAARTENGKKAYIVDLDKESPHEDQHQLRMVPRVEAYAADITYGTNSEYGFDYLRDNMTLQLGDRVQRGHYFAIIDEVDNVLIDEARTPLIISGPAEDESSSYAKMALVVRQLRPEDIEVDDKIKIVVLTELGEIHVEEIMGTPLRDPDRPEDLTPDQAKILGYLEQSLRAHYLFKKNKDYLVQAGKVVIVDEFTGRLMPGRRWSDGLHQAVEAKEGVKIEPESVTYATITIQNYFRMYEKLAGMTGTALTESEEFSKIYNLDAVSIPTNLEYIAVQPDSNLIEKEGNEGKYKFQFYTHKDDPDQKPIYWRRQDYPDIVFKTLEMKLRAITQEIFRSYVLGRPVLVGTTSVELSERVSHRLRSETLRKFAMATLIRKTWLTQHDREEDGRQIQELQFLYAPIDDLDLAEMRKMARELSMSSSPEDPTNLPLLEEILQVDPGNRVRIISALQGGISHQVLNARKHTEESQIIAGAGAFAAVTIATNMAGRGVDIKLGGELAEEVLSAVNRVLKRAGHENPYAMNLAERQTALHDLSPEEYGIYETEVKFFHQYLEEMEVVRSLGGLHVIGSERHEARRIDNQLRGRAARQGDPGSSRFYLSMEDDLMRLFGGTQAQSLMQRLKIDDAVPLEANLVARLVEQSQNRVEGANFDMRKHLLEYDDVLNNQRKRIYTQRDLVFQKDDLNDDIREILSEELEGRVRNALKNQEGPWELLAWLSDIQPPIISTSLLFPSFTLKILTDEIFQGSNGSLEKLELSTQEANETVLKVLIESLKSEEEHLLRAVKDLFDKSQERLLGQLDERREALSAFLETLSEQDETDNRRPVDLFNDLQNSLSLPLRLSPDQQKQLRKNPASLRKEVEAQMVFTLTAQILSRLLGSIERRLDDSLNIQVVELANQDWQDIQDQFISALQSFFERRQERLIGNGTSGIMAREVIDFLTRLDEPITREVIIDLLFRLPQGSRSSFDKKTHRKITLATSRVSYFYHSAQLIGSYSVDETFEKVRNHLEQALKALDLVWGEAEWEKYSALTPAELGDQLIQSIKTSLGEKHFTEILTQQLLDLPAEEKRLVSHRLGQRALTEIFRHLILSVISNLWIDYLTEMEALRVSIGLEAYAQRDPLVQYKNRAFELFQQLLSNVRLGVISRMFTYRPRFQTAPVYQSSRTLVRIPEQAEEKEAKPGISDADAQSYPDGLSKQPGVPESNSRSGRSQKRKRHRR
jgi:preprotein translocase subunit SecA